MQSINEKTLAQIVTLKPASAAVFEKYGLDFCCKGKCTLQQACSEDQLKLSTVENELKKIFESDMTMPDDKHFDKMNVEELINYIVSKHHHYLKEYLPLIHAHLQKVAFKHGENHPELHDIFKLFSEAKEELDQHMFKEENILFPRIIEINDALTLGNPHWMPEKNYINAPINVMEDEHEKVGNILSELRKLTSDYIPPDNACTTYRLGFNELRDIELDLHQHIHLENNILFPRAIEMQQKLQQVLFN